MHAVGDLVTGAFTNAHTAIAAPLAAHRVAILPKLRLWWNARSSSKRRGRDRRSGPTRRSTSSRTARCSGVVASWGFTSWGVTASRVGSKAIRVVIGEMTVLLEERKGRSPVPAVFPHVPQVFPTEACGAFGMLVVRSASPNAPQGAQTHHKRKRGAETTARTRALRTVGFVDVGTSALPRPRDDLAEWANVLAVPRIFSTEPNNPTDSVASRLSETTITHEYSRNAVVLVARLLRTLL